MFVLSIPGTHTNIERVKYNRVYSVALCSTIIKISSRNIGNTKIKSIGTHQRTEGLSRFKGTNLQKMNTITSNIHPDNEASDLC